MKAFKNLCKLVADHTSAVVIAFAVVTFFYPAWMGWVNHAWFTDFAMNKFTSQTLIIGVIMMSMGMSMTSENFKVLAERPLDIFIGALAQFGIMPFLAYGLVHLLGLPSDLALGLILVGCCPGGVSSNIMSYLCNGDVAFSVGMTTASTLLSPLLTPLLVATLASGATIHINAFPMFVSIIETVILPVAVGFALNAWLGKNKAFQEVQQVMPAVAVLGLAFVVGGVINSQGASFFTSGLMIFVAVLLHNAVGYCLGYVVGILTKMGVAKRRTISIEVGMQNAGMATNLANTTAQFATMPDAAVIAAVSCVWHSISGTLLAGFFASLDKRREAAEAGEVEAAANSLQMAE